MGLANSVTGSISARASDVLSSSSVSGRGLLRQWRQFRLHLDVVSQNRSLNLLSTLSYSF
jgi:hypothetical protein